MKQKHQLFIYFLLDTYHTNSRIMFIGSDYFLACSLKSLGLFVLILFSQAAEKASLAFSRNSSLSRYLSLFRSSRSGRYNENNWKNVTKPKPKPMTHTLRLGLCTLCASPWPSRPRCSPIMSGQMPHSAVVVVAPAVVGFVREAPLPPSATKQSKAEKKMWAEDKRCVDRRRREGEGQLNWSWALRFWLLLFLRSPLSTPIPCGFVYVRRLCCVSVINEITLFLLLLPPPGISCFCFLLLAFVFVVYFSITFRCSCCFCCCHVFCFVSCCCPLACRQSLQRRVRLRLWLRFICFYLSFSRFTYWAESSWPRPLCCLAAGAANFAQISNAFCGLRLQLRRDGGLGLSGLFRLFAWRK